MSAPDAAPVELASRALTSSAAGASVSAAGESPVVGAESSDLPAAAQAHSCCAQGTLHVGKTVGFEAKLADLDVYIVHPPTSGSSLPADAPPGTAAVGASALILLHDIFGWKLPNSRLLADRFAAALGVSVYLPDFFSGEQLHPEDWDPLVEKRGFFGRIAQGFQFMVALPKLLSFMKRHGPAVVRPHMDRFITHLRTVEGAQRIGAIGYCWGGRYAVVLTHPQTAPAAAAAPSSSAPAASEAPKSADVATDKAVATTAATAQPRLAIDAAVACHPSLLELPEMAAAAAPVLYVCAATDNLFTPAAVASAKRMGEERAQAAAAAGGAAGPAAGGAGAAASASGANTAPVSVIEYPGTRHGFAVRGDDAEPGVAAARQKAFDDAVAFLRPRLVLTAAASADSAAAPALPSAAVTAASPAAAVPATAALAATPPSINCCGAASASVPSEATAATADAAAGKATAASRATDAESSVAANAATTTA